MVVDPLFKEGTDVPSLADKLVLSHMSHPQRVRFDKILSDWEGREVDVISVIHYAIQQEKFGEYAEHLEEIFKDHLSRVPKADRRNFDHPLALRAERAVEKLYQSLGIEPTD